MSPAHHPWQLWPDPAATFLHLLPGPGTNLCGGQAGEPEPEEGGDQRGEGRAAALRYQAQPDPRWTALKVNSRGVWRQLSRPPDHNWGLLVASWGRGFPDANRDPRKGYACPQEALQTMRRDCEKRQLRVYTKRFKEDTDYLLCGLGRAWGIINTPPIPSSRITIPPSEMGNRPTF